MNLPIYTRYKGLTEAKLSAIAGNDPDRIKRDEEGKICMVWLYNDGTNPMNQAKDSPELWDKYFQKLKLLAKLVASEEE